jgi:AraC-like DNA-binding protein
VESFWTTRGVASDEQFEYWRDVICDAFLPLEPVFADAQAFQGSVAAVALREFHLASVRANAHTVTRTPRHIARTHTGAFFANLIRTGTATARQAGNQAEAVAGDIVLLDTDEPFAFDLRGTCDVVCLTIPQAALRPRLGRRGLPASPVVTARTAAGRLASRYLSALSTEAEPDLFDLEDSVFDHVCYLLAQNGEAHADVSKRDALRARILRYVDVHFQDPELTVDAACAALHLSRSHLYGVLGEAGLSFAGEVRRRRLAAVDRDLADPRCAGLTVAEIAYRRGFTDPSSFTRTYRAAFATTPTARRGERLPDA